MDNYTFCAEWVQRNSPSTDAPVLDYGCGAGQIVHALRRAGVNARGCDVFYGGGSYEKAVPEELRPLVHKMESNRIPFDDASFDIVVTNQVLEHVEDLDFALAEIARVLRPGGKVLSLFGHRGMWRENHCGIPFLHRFAKGSRMRIYYAAALRGIGFGYWKGDKTVMQWSRDVCDWLDKWTFYRSDSELRSAYARNFRETRHIEDTWVEHRLGPLKPAAALVPGAFIAWAVRPLGGWVAVSSK